MNPNLQKFIAVANEQTTGQGITGSATNYERENKGSKNGFNIEISFGTGRASAIPWVAFTGYNQTIKNGIYPVYLYYKDSSILILAYGVSETNPPSINWMSFEMKQTIEQYFDINFSKKPKRYGSSLIYKVYDAKQLPNDSILEKDLENIIEEYKRVFKDQNFDSKVSEPKNKKLSEFSVNKFNQSLSNSGLIYSDKLILRFTSSLLTKPFVILTGLSGSGKTKLAQAFVQWICEDKDQYRIIPVGADWTNREPLLGYQNGLDPENYVKPENGVLELIINANKNPNLPYFLILDEMNLSHVERYFADFLSAMESDEKIPLHSSEKNKNGVPKTIRIPKNLFIIGTVNIDETTHMFSPKVLDRANTIEFRISKKEMEEFFSEYKELNMDVLTGGGSNIAGSFVSMTLNRTINLDNKKEIQDELLKFFEELSKTGTEFGYRTASEILRFINNLKILDSEIKDDSCMDYAIMQKLLPKLHGSRRKLSDSLKKLAELCCTDIEGKDIELKILDQDDFNDIPKEFIKYPVSLEKIYRMYKSAVQNGFASYAEA